MFRQNLDKAKICNHLLQVVTVNAEEGVGRKKHNVVLYQECYNLISDDVLFLYYHIR